jgi:hypothetical protein
MSNHQLNQQCLDLAQEKAKKHGLELKIEREFNKDVKTGETWEITKIQEPQTRQILLAFKDVLGENPEYVQTDKDIKYCIKSGETTTTNLLKKIQILSPKSQSQTLDDKWFRPDYDTDGKSLFDQEPETVLTELLQILKSI